MTNRSIALAISLLFLCALAASAQTTTQVFSTNIPTVTVSGDVHNPTIENHSGKQVIAAMVWRQLADGTHTVSHRLFTDKANVLPDGGSTKYGEYARRPPGPEVSAKITAVIFADGEFRGEDSYEFQSGVEQGMQSMRQVWQMAKAGDWKGVKAKAEAKDPDNIFGFGLANRLLRARDKDGDAKAVESFAFAGNLPTSTWKGGLLNKLGLPGAFQPIAGWFVPIVHAYPNYNTVGPWPQGTDTDAWHQDQWHYVCNTWPGSSYPCPAVGDTTPYEGASAVCQPGAQFDPQRLQSVVDRLVAEGRMPTQERVNELMQKARSQFRAARNQRVSFW